MTAEQLSAIVGVVLSLAFTYVPSLEEWYAPLSRAKKQLVMLSLVVAVALVIFGAACANFPFDSSVTCTQSSAWMLAKLIFEIAVANQTTYLLTRK